MQPERYSRLTVLLHWLIAVAIFFLFISSWWMLTLPFSSLRSVPFSLHKSIGITLLFLLLVLLFLRLWRRPAAIDSPAMTGWMHKLALLDHVLLYGLIIGVCVSGYLSSAFSGWTTSLWWLVDLPDWADKDLRLNRLFSDLHSWLSWTLLPVIAIHIIGAVYHAMRRDGAIRRMLHL